MLAPWAAPEHVHPLALCCRAWRDVVGPPGGTGVGSAMARTPALFWSGVVAVWPVVERWRVRAMALLPPGPTPPSSPVLLMERSQHAIGGHGAHTTDCVSWVHWVQGGLVVVFGEKPDWARRHPL